jgi:hypothetical protein
VSGGFKELFAGQTVDFDWAPSHQDGYSYSATRVVPRGRPASPRGRSPTFVHEREVTKVPRRPVCSWVMMLSAS